MDWLGVLTGALLALAVALFIFRDAPPRREADPTPSPGRPEGDRIERLLAQITGDGPRDRPLLNRALALGASVLPTVIAALDDAVRDDSTPPARIACLEELVADFGLVAVPPVLTALVRLKPATPLAVSLSRALARLGQPGVHTAFERALATPELAPFLPRLRAAARDPGAALTAAMLHRPAVYRRRDLDTAASLLVDDPEVIDDLWRAWDPAGRVVLLDWLADWRPLAQVAHAARALNDPADDVCAAGARLARLLPLAPLLGPLRHAAHERAPACRAEALATLAADPSSGPDLRAGLADLDPTVAWAAALAWAARPDFDPAAPAPALPTDALDCLHGDLDTVLATLDAPDQPVRPLCVARAAAALGDDPRARERLIRLADSGPLGRDRLAALHALAQEPVAADLLVKALRAAPEAPSWRALPALAAAVGPTAVGPLSRRLRADAARGPTPLLAALRALPLTAAVPPLLRALESAHTAPEEAELAATLRCGGPAVAEAIHDCLMHPDRKLLTAALRYLAICATVDDLPRLIALFDRHPPLRGAVLNLIEALGAPAIPALTERVRAGGEDDALIALEARLARLRACT